MHGVLWVRILYYAFRLYGSGGLHPIYDANFTMQEFLLLHLDMEELSLQ